MRTNNNFILLCKNPNVNGIIFEGIYRLTFTIEHGLTHVEKYK